MRRLFPEGRRPGADRPIGRGTGRCPALPVLLLVFAPLLVGAPLAAQHEHGHAAYSGQEQREIKGLAPERVRGLLDGEGMGLAKSAELNGVPGPAHVLELADRLDLSPEQRRRVEAIHAAMREDAVGLGRRVVRRERELDHRLGSGEITPEEVDEAAGAIGELMGRLRAVHLKAHLSTASLLTEVQIDRYRRLRGYAGGSGDGR